MSDSLGNTQPLKPVKKTPRWRSILISLGGVIVLLALAGVGGFQIGIQERLAAKSTVISSQLSDQFARALVDEQAGRYDDAKSRLEFIIQNDPSFPGAQVEYTKVLVISKIPTATPTPTLTPTPDLRGEQTLFTTAQQLIAKGDWPNALAELDQLRKEDPTFNASQVDGMYYFTLRNYGVDLIIKQGNLEGGIYQLDLAERFGPLDRDANQYREGAQAYVQAASYWQVNWGQAANLFQQVASGWPSLWDGSMTASQRYQFALMRYGDVLFSNSNFCDAYQQYKAAESLGNLDQQATKYSNQAYQQCYPPTEVPPTSAPPAPTATP